MAYTPTEWVTGDVITAVKLNKLENGVAAIDGVMVVEAEAEGDTLTLDATYAEIAAAMTANIPVFVKLETSENENMYFMAYNNGIVSGDTDTYTINVYDMSSGQTVSFTTDSADGYPENTVV